MMNFIVLDTGNYKAGIFEEREFIETFDADPMDPEDYDCRADRITDLVQSNGYDIAWCHQDAVDMVIDEIQILSVEEGGDDETLVGLAKMLITIGESSWWDHLIDLNTPGEDPEYDFDL